MTRTAAVVGVVLLAAGLVAGWMARGRYDAFERSRKPPEEDDKAEAAPPAAAPRAPRTHDDELRQVLIDPKAHALAARVRNASNVGGQCEVEVDTTVGWFRVACGTGDTPSVGERFELFGRVSPDGQIDGAPPLLRPSWLEPVGTIARLRGQ